MISGWCNRRCLGPVIHESYVDGHFFVEWLKGNLIPELKKGQVVLLDNAPIHCSMEEEIEELVESVGCRVIWLPRYSPDLNPIEKFWANIKRKVRSVAHSFDSFHDAICFAFQNL